MAQGSGRPQASQSLSQCLLQTSLLPSDDPRRCTSHIVHHASRPRACVSSAYLPRPSFWRPGKLNHTLIVYMHTYACLPHSDVADDRLPRSPSRRARVIPQDALIVPYISHACRRRLDIGDWSSPWLRAPTRTSTSTPHPPHGLRTGIPAPGSASSAQHRNEKQHIRMPRAKMNCTPPKSQVLPHRAFQMSEPALAAPFTRPRRLSHGMSLSSTLSLASSALRLRVS